MRVVGYALMVTEHTWLERMVSEKGCPVWVKEWVEELVGGGDGNGDDKDDEEDEDGGGGGDDDEATTEGMVGLRVHSDDGWEGLTLVDDIGGDDDEGGAAAAGGDSDSDSEVSTLVEEGQGVEIASIQSRGKGGRQKKKRDVKVAIRMAFRLGKGFWMVSLHIALRPQQCRVCVLRSVVLFSHLGLMLVSTTSGCVLRLLTTVPG